MSFKYQHESGLCLAKKDGKDYPKCTEKTESDQDFCEGLMDEKPTEHATKLLAQMDYDESIEAQRKALKEKVASMRIT